MELPPGDPYRELNIYILVIASYAYIELPAGSSRRELRFWAMASVLLIPSGAITEIISRSTINICSVASILIIAPSSL